MECPYPCHSVLIIYNTLAVLNKSVSVFYHKNISINCDSVTCGRFSMLETPDYKGKKEAILEEDWGLGLTGEWSNYGKLLGRQIWSDERTVIPALKKKNYYALQFLYRVVKIYIFKVLFWMGRRPLHVYAFDNVDNYGWPQRVKEWRLTRYHMRGHIGSEKCSWMSLFTLRFTTCCSNHLTCRTRKKGLILW